MVVSTQYDLPWYYGFFSSFSTSPFSRKRRQKALENNYENISSDDVVAVGEPEESLALNDVRSQLLRFVDLFIWTALLGFSTMYGQI